MVTPRMGDTNRHSWRPLAGRWADRWGHRWATRKSVPIKSPIPGFQPFLGVLRVTIRALLSDTYRNLRSLITQRSLVQIQPPQPIKSIAYDLMVAPTNSHKLPIRKTIDQALAFAGLSTISTDLPIRFSSIMTSPAHRRSSSSGSRCVASVPVAPSSVLPSRRARNGSCGGRCAGATVIARRWMLPSWRQPQVLGETRVEGFAVRISDEQTNAQMANYDLRSSIGQYSSKMWTFDLAIRSRL